MLEVMPMLLILMVPLNGDPTDVRLLQSANTAQSAPAVESAPTVEIAEAEQSPPPPPRTIVRSPAPPAGGRFRPFAVATTVYDTNINHDLEDLDAYGMTFGVGALFRNNTRKPTLEVQYLSGFHRYARTDRWNRFSHYARVAWDRRLAKRLALETVGEASVGGSNEDRELGNQFVASPRLEFRFTPVVRVRGYGAWRIKRYDDSPDRNAFNQYGGLELIGRPPNGTRWDIGGRYELNAAESDRQRYLRWTWYGALSKPIRATDRLELGMRYRRQRYPLRFVDMRGPDPPRQDWRVEPDISWLHAIDDDVELRVGYGYNGRKSNDVRRDYRSHEVVASILQRW